MTTFTSIQKAIIESCFFFSSACGDCNIFHFAIMKNDSLYFKMVARQRRASGASKDLIDRRLLFLGLTSQTGQQSNFCLTSEEPSRVWCSRAAFPRTFSSSTSHSPPAHLSVTQRRGRAVRATSTRSTTSEPGRSKRSGNVCFPLWHPPLAKQQSACEPSWYSSKWAKR